MTRRFDRSELAFLAVPRTWREIEMRFGSEAKTEPFRDCVILADNEGGSGDLRYLREVKSWVLTDAGKARVGERLVARELRVYPDKRTAEAFDEATETVEDPFAELLCLPGPLDPCPVSTPPFTTADIAEAEKKLAAAEIPMIGDHLVFPVQPGSIVDRVVRADDPQTELERLIAEQAKDDDG